MSLPRIEILAGCEDTSWAGDLIVALRAWSLPLAPHPETPPPDAYLALSPGAVHLTEAFQSGIPVAVIADHPFEIPDSIADRATVVSVRGARTVAASTATVAWRSEAIDAGRHPCLSPFVRQRWRAALGLPDPWVIEFDGHRSLQLDPALHPTALALCSAAVVTGSDLVTALALGTPVVTSAAAAEFLGAEAGVHLLVAAADRYGAACALAQDQPRAAALGWGGRTLVEEQFDLRGVAVALLDELGIGPAPFPIAPLAGLDAELAALGTPSSSPVANRILHRVANLMPGADWADLTGRRR